MSFTEGPKLGSLFNTKALLTGGGVVTGLVIAHEMKMDPIFYVFNPVAIGIVGYTVSDDIVQGIRNARNYIRSLGP
jgi:hypothetical protein